MLLFLMLIYKCDKFLRQKFIRNKPSKNILFTLIIYFLYIYISHLKKTFSAKGIKSRPLHGNHCSLICFLLLFKNNNYIENNCTHHSTSKQIGERCMLIAITLLLIFFRRLIHAL